MANEILITKEGYDALEKRLEVLLTEKRMEIAEKIKIAREFGDISENAEYDAAKEEQTFIEAEIKEIQLKLGNAKIIDEDSITSKEVSIGSTVKIEDIEFGEKLEYKIVGSTEANSFENKLSNESPVGAALLGKKKGAVVSVSTPSGEIKIKVLAIK